MQASTTQSMTMEDIEKHRRFFTVPRFRALLGEAWRYAPDGAMEQRLDILASILASYPNQDTEAIAKTYGMAPGTISILAHYFGVYKSKAKRREINIKNGRDVFLRLLYARKRDASHSQADRYLAARTDEQTY